MRTIYGVHLKDRRRALGLILMLILNAIIDRMAMVDSKYWYGRVLRMEGGHVLRRTLDVKVDVHERKVRPKRTWMKKVEEESVKFVLSREDMLC